MDCTAPGPTLHHPYWHDQVGPMPVLPVDPPQEADVVIVGSGYTGLSAAIATARGGRKTL